MNLIAGEPRAGNCSRLICVIENTFVMMLYLSNICAKIQHLRL